MMCFREGCPCGIGGPGSVEVAIEIGTRGKIGVSQARVTLGFCSPKCVAQFWEECPTQPDVLEKIAALCKNKEGMKR